ncbi:hypothetical protein BJY01DRAFT_164254 [Aspergillus pseudoustus]|uniref:Uncharacterized protein n=1 Tax=Aspergillus pseudoustus TaxID=1810923 RepID=A0ABR4K618_9EURO
MMDSPTAGTKSPTKEIRVLLDSLASSRLFEIALRRIENELWSTRQKTPVNQAFCSFSRVEGLVSPGRESITSILGEVVFDGPNGEHGCLVGGCSPATFKANSPNLMIPLDIAWSIVAQVTASIT